MFIRILFPSWCNYPILKTITKVVDDNAGKDLTGKHRVPDAEEIFEKTEDPYLIKTKQKQM